MKTGSKVLLGLGIIVIIIAAVLMFLISNLDAIVKAAIENFGSRATGTEVKVASVKLDLRGGTGAISGLSIGNPPGFSSPRVFELGDITVELDTASVTKDPMVIERIEIKDPHVTYELNNAGKANVNELRNRLAKPGAAEAPPEPKEPGAAKKIVIRNLVIEGGKVDVRIDALPDEQPSAELPRIHLKNVGGEGGALPSELAVQVLRPLADRAIQAAAETGVRQYLGKSAEEVRKMAEEAAGKALGTAGEEAAKEAEGALKKLLGK